MAITKSIINHKKIDFTDMFGNNMAKFHTIPDV